MTLIALLDRFKDEEDFDSAFYWFVQASRFGRYSGSGTTTLEEDLKAISSATSFHEAVASLLVPLQPLGLVRTEDFLNDYSDGRFWRFLLYLLVYKNEAQDWSKSGARLGFEGKEILADFTPQWHHIYPQKFLHKKVDEDKIQALANIAVIGPSINIRISAQDPMKYLDKYGISDEKLRQQFLEMGRSDLTVEKFPEFIEKRAAKLAEEANSFLSNLSRSLPDSVRPVTNQVTTAV